MDSSKLAAQNPSPPSVENHSAGSSTDDKLHVDFRVLPGDESLALLAKHHVGRLGISFHDVMRVEIANYVYAEGWIYARTVLGADVLTVRHHPWVAFEVDEVEGIYDWRSVEVSGAAEFLASDMSSHDWFKFENAVRLLRDVISQVLTADDPVAERVQLLRMHVDNVRGRESRASIQDALPPA